MHIMEHKKLIIIGSGCAGLTAAIYASRANLQPLVIDGEQPCGQLTTTSDVENFPGFPNGINGYELMNNMRMQADRFGTAFLPEKVTGVELHTKTVHTPAKLYTADAIIISTGAKPKMLNIPGEHEFYGGRGVSSCATCDGAFYRGRDVVVIGGGDSACEEALFLTRFCNTVYLVHRRNELRASPVMAERVKNHEKIRIFWNTIPVSIFGDQKVNGITLDQQGRIFDLPCACIFLGIGHTPNTEILHRQLPLDDDGYIISDGVNTSIPGVFVAGDCCDKVYRQAITASAMGCMAAISAERYLK